MKNKLNGFLCIMMDIMSLIVLIYFIILISISLTLDHNLSQFFDVVNESNISIVATLQFLIISLLVITAPKIYYYMVVYYNDNASFDNIIFEIDKSLSYKNIVSDFINNDSFKDKVITDIKLLKKETLYFKKRDKNIEEFKEWFTKLLFN